MGMFRKVVPCFIGFKASEGDVAKLEALVAACGGNKSLVMRALLRQARVEDLPVKTRRIRRSAVK